MAPSRQVTLRASRQKRRELTINGVLNMFAFFSKSDGKILEARPRYAWEKKEFLSRVNSFQHLGHAVYIPLCLAESQITVTFRGGR